MAGTAVTCATVNDYFARNDNMFGVWVHEQLRESSPWYAITPKEAFPQGAGYTIRDIMIERMSTYNDQGSWNNITASDGTTTNPLSQPTLTQLNWGQSYTSWNPQYQGYLTPCISLDDLKFDHNVVDQVTKTVAQLTQVSDEIFSNRARYECARIMPQISARPGFGPNGIVGVTDTTVMVNKAGVVIPTSKITQSLLDTAYSYLLRQGAGAASSRANMQDGQPTMSLVISREASDDILRQANVRDDVRWGDPGELLKPLGVTRVFRGFAHIIDPELPRFDLVAGQLVRRLPWASASADSGTKAIVNNAYNNAEYELYYIKPMDAYAYAVIKDSSAKDIAGASFEDYPYYYANTFFWHNVKDNTTNILGKLGKWISISAAATHPHYPARGLTIIAKRCPNDQAFASCSYS